MLSHHRAPGLATAHHRPHGRWGRAQPSLGVERGSSTVEFVICTAAAVLLLLMVLQIGVWYHTRAVAQTAARHGVDHVRTTDGSTDSGIDIAHEFLAQSGNGLRDPDVSAQRTLEVSSVSVSGDVVSILPGVTLTVSVTVDAPTERIEP